MEDKKDSSTKELKLEKKNGKGKKEWTVKRVLTTVIIGILALLMVGGSFYYIFTPGFRSDANAFGFYDGEPVLYENNSIFARTLQSDENYATYLNSGDYNSLWTSWYKAYQSQVVYIALAKMAEEAKISAPQELVNNMILDSGAFNNESGEFDKAIYDATSDADKRNLYSYMLSMYPFQTVLGDIYSALTSAQETAFVAEVASDARTFDYFVVGANTYPDYLARAYVNENADKFKLVNISMISCDSQESAQNCYTELQAGLSWEDAVVKYSLDSYASNNGYVGAELFAGVFEDNVKDGDISVITGLKAGEYTIPNEGPYAWTIYKVNEDVKDPDLDNSTILNQVKQLIYNDEPELVQNYIDEAVAQAAKMSEENFDEAAALYSPGLVTVGPAANNIGGTDIIYGIDDFDSTGYLAEATEADEDLEKTLYKSNIGYIAGPIDVENGSLFVRVTAESKEEGLGQLTQAMYAYYANEFDALDVQNAIISSEKHKDNFTTKFMELFLGY